MEWYRKRTLGQLLDEAATRHGAREALGRIASFKIPRHVVNVDGFPMTSSATIRKVELRAQAMLLIESERSSSRN